MDITFLQHRPPGIRGLGDSRLPVLIEQLTNLLIDAQGQLTYDTLYLPDEECQRMAHVLVEFAEDIQHKIGIWESLEQYNRDFFGTPLPLTLPLDSAPPKTPALKDRITHLLWVLYPEIYPDLILAPTHQDLRLLAGIVTNFLQHKTKRRWKQSGVKRFLLDRRNKYGWEVKRKLVWLGRNSYLFRHNFKNYVAEHGGKADIPTIDDYICRETTAWSGLGAIDILARLLPLTEAQRSDLRSWNERHASYYQIAGHRSTGLDLVNLVNNEPYSVYMDEKQEMFEAGVVVFGSLVPWEGEWYWSGEQRLLGTLTDSEKEKIVKKLVSNASRIIYRYDKERLARAQETLDRMRQQFMEQFGDSLAVFPDGPSLAAGMQKMYDAYQRSLLLERGAISPDEEAGSSGAPKMTYPPEIMEREDGVGVFFNPDEGTELMTGFHVVTSGLKKRGAALSEDEMDAIQGFMQSENISPQFVQRVVQDHGPESVAAAFLIRDRAGQPYLDYLLRRYKGHFYRNRYPSISLVG